MMLPNAQGRTATINLMREATAASVRNLRRVYDRGQMEGANNFPVRQSLSKMIIKTANTLM